MAETTINSESVQTPFEEYNNNINNNNISEIDNSEETENCNSGANSEFLMSSVDNIPRKMVVLPEMTRDALSKGAQQIIDELNSKRKQDTKLLANVRLFFEEQVEKICKSVEHHLFQVYETQGKELQDKLQELFSIIDRITKLESELQEFKESLQILYKEMTD